MLRKYQTYCAKAEYLRVVAQSAVVCVWGGGGKQFAYASKILRFFQQKLRKCFVKVRIVQCFQ